MDGMVRQLAEAQGLSRHLDALLAIRDGIGLRDCWDLLRLPGDLRLQLAGSTGEDLATLERCFLEFERRIDESPSDQKALLEVALNLRQHLGASTWAQRQKLIAGSAIEQALREAEWRVDLSLLQLLMRLRPAAEANPAPAQVAPTNHVRRPGPAKLFFTEDYVNNSQAFRVAWESAHTIDMWGFGHNRMSITYSSEMVALLSRGGSIRILLQDPEGASVIEANRRSSTPKASDEAVRYQHRAGVVTLQAIRERARAEPDAMQIRTFDGMPPFTAYFFDGDTVDASAFIWFWSWRQPSSWRPGFRIFRKEDPDWHARFYDQFHDLWTECAEDSIPSGGPS